MGREKGACLLFRKPLIEYSLEVLGSICDQVILGTSNKNYGYLEIPLIADEYEGVGPLGGIYSCLKASSTRDNFVLSCDMPLVSEELIRFILTKKKDDDVIIPVFRGKPEPICAYYNKRITGFLEEFILKKKYKVQDVVKELKTRYLEIDSSLHFYSEELFFNVNFPGDIERLEQFMQNGIWNE